MLSFRSYGQRAYNNDKQERYTDTVYTLKILLDTFSAYQKNSSL